MEFASEVSTQKAFADTEAENSEMAEKVGKGWQNHAS